MEILSAFGGAIIGAVLSFALTEYTKRKDEWKKFYSALHTEIVLNLDVAPEILLKNTNINFDARGGKQWGWCEVIPFSEAAWIAITSTGVISRFDEKVIDLLTRSYALVKRANFIAEKIKAGRYDPREGKEYTLRVQETREVLEATLKALDSTK
jgi:hypothetical protein